MQTGRSCCRDRLRLDLCASASALLRGTFDRRDAAGRRHGRARAGVAQAVTGPGKFRPAQPEAVRRAEILITAHHQFLRHRAVYFEQKRRNAA